MMPNGLSRDADGFARRRTDKTRMIQDPVTGEWFDPAAVERTGWSWGERLLWPVIEGLMNVVAVVVFGSFLIAGIYLLSRMVQAILWGMGG